MTINPPTIHSSVLLVGNPRQASRTRLAGAAVLEAVASGHRPHRIIELANHVAIGLRPEPVRPTLPVDQAVTAVRTATLLVIATPAYKGTFTGLLKVFLDLLAQDDLAGAVVVPVAVASSREHADRAVDDLTAVVGELGATVPASGFAVTEAGLPALDEHLRTWLLGPGAVISQALAERRIAA